LILYLGIAATLSTVPFLYPFEEQDHFWCILQGWFISFNDWSVGLWVTVISFNLLVNTYYEYFDSSRLEIVFHVFVWALSIVMSTLPFLSVGKDVFQSEEMSWCWIDSHYQQLRVIEWYLPLLFMFVVNVVFVGLSIFRLLKREDPRNIYDSIKMDKSGKRKAFIRLSKHPIVFIMIWIIPMIDRAQHFIDPNNPIFMLVLFHGICVSSQGTVNSWLYCYDEDVFKNCHKRKIMLSTIHTVKRYDGFQNEPVN